MFDFLAATVQVSATSRRRRGDSRVISRQLVAATAETSRRRLRDVAATVEINETSRRRRRDVAETSMHKFSFPFSGDVAATSPRLTRLLGPYSGESSRGFSNSRQPRLISLGSRELVSAGEIGA